MDKAQSRPRVLVIRGGAIGDFILTLPAIRLIRETIVGCHLEVLGYPGIADLALVAGLADATRNLEHRTMAPLFAKNAAIEEAISDYFRGFNLVVSYLYDPDGHLRANLERIGVRGLVEASHRVEEGKGHAAYQLARPLEKLAMFLDDPAPQLKIMPTSRPNQGQRIALHPGSGSTRKNWPLEHWIRLGRELAAAHPTARLALVTGEAERERGMTSALVEAWAGLPYDHLDCLPLYKLAGELAACDAFLGHDSGISHLAAACGIPCLLFFGPTDPATWAPCNAWVSVHRAADGDWQQLGYDKARAAAADFMARKFAPSAACDGNVAV